MSNKVFLIICFAFSVALSFSQTKNEKEERIKKEAFPKIALLSLDALPQSCNRFKFYRETDGDKKSYEVKFKYNRKLYSVEFNSEGILEDVEVKIKPKSIPLGIHTNIKTYLKGNFDKYKLIKVQEQYIYSGESFGNEYLKTILLNTKATPPNFEIIAEVKQNKKRTIKEFTFNSKGEFLSARILNRTSYEHVLY
ncbi:hypothetical protein [Winogradskyella alexanderae]|uniref:Outer membrane lipoprotein carrier protein LolA n=1 Tax=Winogradskyella alexanderae TaxID=2877123 RepID=A0ABS7XNT7_9FLAO|nr:hypothetical protein [Winogradskyella alexanderae]MCA0131049.1 hypothetical protein [Winogradskyella alexanderae]